MLMTHSLQSLYSIIDFPRTQTSKIKKDAEQQHRQQQQQHHPPFNTTIQEANKDLEMCLANFLPGI